MNLVPQSSFSIIRQIDNVNDTGTYYVRAVVRNINTGATIATINLASKGNQRYSAPWQVPADTSGQGTYISITTYVFDDSGYSVPDQNYATEDKEYLIIQPPISSYGNGGTTVIDYDKIRKMVLDGIKFPGIPTYDKDFKGLQKSTDERFNDIRGHIEKQVKSIVIPKYDDSELRNSVASLKQELAAARASHENSIRSMSLSHSAAINGLKSHHAEIVKMMGEKLSKIADRPYAAERDRDELAKNYDGLKKDYQSLAGVIKAVQTSGKYEDTAARQSSIDARVRKLMGT